MSTSAGIVTYSAADGLYTLPPSRRQCLSGTGPQNFAAADASLGKVIELTPQDTSVYVRRANSEYDELTKQILAEEVNK